MLLRWEKIKVVSMKQEKDVEIEICWREMCVFVEE